jgi:hypothetical protein
MSGRHDDTGPLAAARQGRATTHPASGRGLAYGEFPFPLTHGPNESRFLTWLRNHSNYMAVDGLLDYLRMGSVLVRGIFINNLILLPPLLIIAVAFSLAYKWMAQHQWLLTLWMLACATGWILLFPVLTMLTKIARYQKSLASGSDSSVVSRDRYERSFAYALLLVLGVALLDLLPHIVSFYHYRLNVGLPWREYLAAATVAMGSLSAAPKLLHVLTGVWRKLAIAVIAVGGVVAPLFVIVVVSDFLIFPDLKSTKGIDVGQVLALIIIVTPFPYVLGIACAGVIGLFKRAFSGREYWRLLLLLLGILAVHAALSGIMIGGYLLAADFYKAQGAAGVEALETVRNQLFVFACAVEVWMFCWLMVDINQTSLHGLYRDRLASAFVLGVNAQGDVDVEEDVPLGELSYRATGSTAPYHLMNVALNLQGSEDIGLRDRHSDFFIFSEKFIGGERTGYCRTSSMEQVFPQVNLASAMAISAAAASPNMGRGTSPALVAFMTLINVRLGVWVPNPGLLEEHFGRRAAKARARHQAPADRAAKTADDEDSHPQKPGFAFAEVFAGELTSITQRWEQAGATGDRRLARDRSSPTPAHGLAGLAFSGGGIRSATINLGIAQALHDAGIFRHFDYMSTVSGGGYLGAGISSVMRYRTLPVSQIAGRATVEAGVDGSKTVRVTGEKAGAEKIYRYSKDADVLVRDGEAVKPGTRLIDRQGLRLRSEIAGTVRVKIAENGQQIVTVSGRRPGETRHCAYTKYDEIDVTDGESIEAGRLLVKQRSSFSERFRWRVRPEALLLEMTMRLNEKRHWVNLSDGGHIENLAAIELLRRRCKIIVIGDGEADRMMHFNGLATLIRTARLDLGIEIDIRLDELRLDAESSCKSHMAVGRITYPDETECGHLLYLKSSFTGDEDEVIGEYRHRSPDFPHETTADQFFTEGQFEAYRALGQHIGEHALEVLGLAHAKSGSVTFAKLAGSFESFKPPASSDQPSQASGSISSHTASKPS